jgi:flagellar hook assembly protein FlgD
LAGVYDLSGRRVAVLADGWFTAGDHSLQWNGNQAGKSAAAGVYMMRIQAPKNILLHKVMLLK